MDEHPIPTTPATSDRPARRLRWKRLKLRRVELHKMMFVLPNLFTLSSIFCGFYAIILATDRPGPQNLYRAALAVFFGVFFDAADGRVARMTRTQSKFGVELDSLADLVTFGVAPAVIVYKWGLSELGFPGALAGFLFVACGAMRLARFNVLAQSATKSMRYFIGLPIPLAAGVLISLVMFHQRAIAEPLTRHANIIVLVVILSFLMVSNVRYRTFKDVHLTRRSLTVIVTLIMLFALIALRVRPTFALLAFFSGYLVIGLLEEVIFFRRRRREERAAAPR